MHRKLFLGALLLFVQLTVSCSGSSGKEELEKARAAGASGDFKTALIHYKNVLQTNEQDAKLRVEYALVLERSGDFSAAEQQLRRAVELGGNKNELQPRVAAWMLDRNESRNLVKEFQEITLDDKFANADLRAIVTLAFLNQGRVADAEKEIFKTTESTPTVSLARAQILGLKADLPATKLLASETRSKLKGTAQTPHHWWVWRGLGRLALSMGESTQALDDLRAAKDAMPSHFGVAGELGETLLSLGKVPEARTELAALMKSAPNYFRTVLLNALIKFNDGDSDAAYELALKVLSRVPENVTANLMSAGIDISRGNLATAEARLSQILKINPNVIEAMRFQANIAAKRGDFALSDRIVRSALARSPNNQSLVLDVAESHLAQNQLKEARPFAQRALALNPRSVRALIALIELEARSANKSKATEYFDQALVLLEFEPTASESLFRLALRHQYLDKANTIVKQEAVRRPNDPNPLLWQVIAASEQKKPKEAIQYLKQSLAKKKDFYPALAIFKSIYAGEKLAPDYEAYLRAGLTTKSKDERIGLDYLAFLRAQGSKPEQILELGRSLVNDNPESVRLRLELAQMLLAAKKPGDADQVINQGLSDHAKTAGMSELGATWAESRSAFGIALERYTKLATQYPENVTYVLKRAQLMYRDGKKEESLKVYEQAVKLRPEDEGTNRELAYARFSAGQKSAALKGADDYAALPNHAVDGLLLKADLLLADQNFAEAKKMIATAQKAGGGDRAIYALVAVLDRQNAQAEADKTIEAWLKSNPQSVHILSLAARRAAKTQDHRKSVHYLGKLLAIRADQPMLLNDLAWAQASLKLPGAVSNAKKALEGLPDHPQVLDTLAFALVQEGQTEEAIRTLRQVVSLKPEMATPRLNLAELLIAKNDRPEAKEVLSTLEPAKLGGGLAERYKSLTGQVSQ